MAKQKFAIVTPTATVVSLDVDFVVIPGAVGELGVLPGHAPLVTQLRPGIVRYTDGGTESKYRTADGYAMVTPEAVTICTTDAHLA